MYSVARAVTETEAETEALIRETDTNPPVETWGGIGYDNEDSDSDSVPEEIRAQLQELPHHGWQGFYQQDSDSDEDLFGNVAFGGGSTYYDTMGSFGMGKMEPTGSVLQSTAIQNSEQGRLEERLAKLTLRSGDAASLFTQHGPGNSPPPLTPVAIAEMGDKIRLASTHGAREVWISRRLNQLWLPTLKRNRLSRDMLKGRTITLSRSKGKGNPRKALLYSADLSAATDYIPHELGIVLAKWLNSKVFTDPEITGNVGTLPSSYC
jgi:hypothetical protein